MSDYMSFTRLQQFSLPCLGCWRLTVVKGDKPKSLLLALPPHTAAAMCGQPEVEARRQRRGEMGKKKLAGTVGIWWQMLDCCLCFSGDSFVGSSEQECPLAPPPLTPEFHLLVLWEASSPSGWTFGLLQQLHGFWSWVQDDLALPGGWLEGVPF